MMLVCYLDDSGKDTENPITTIAGYVASEDEWAAFEQQVEPYFVERKVSILHAVDRVASQTWHLRQAMNQVMAASIGFIVRFMARLILPRRARPSRVRAVNDR
jgi:hypothetical protein